jgi:acyl carrier protein
MSNRLYKLFASVLKIPEGSINDDTSQANTPRWDSLASMNLVLALEEEFDVRIGTKDASEMKNIGIVKAVLLRKGVKDI